jgi:hypothetical protein
VSTSFGFCSACAAPRLAPEQGFCANCGAALSAVTPPQPAPQPAQPQAWQPQPAQQDWSAGYPQGYPGYAPARSSNKGVIAAIVGGAGVVLVLAIIFAVVLISGGGSKGGITFSPATVSCSSPVSFTLTAQLPSSVHAGDTVTVTLDGRTMGTDVLTGTSTAVQQADGSWTITNTSSVATMQSLCAAGGAAGGVNVLTPGTHTEQILDSTGKVLATGSYTVTP